MSYRAAWDALDEMNNLAEQPLVVRTAGGKNGGGTQLPPTVNSRPLLCIARCRRNINKFSKEYNSNCKKTCQQDDNFTTSRNFVVYYVSHIDAQ